MTKKKNVMIFGNKSELLKTNRLCKAGIYTILAGVITLVIGGKNFYKTVGGIQCDDPASDTINDMYNSLTKKNG